MLKIYPACGRGARVSACAGLINQLQSCRFDPGIACKRHSNCIATARWGFGDFAVNWVKIRPICSA